MHGEMSSHASFFKVVCEFGADIFPPSIRTQTLDHSPSLDLDPGLVLSISPKSFKFHLEQIDMILMSVHIMIELIVMVSPQQIYLCWAP